MERFDWQPITELSAPRLLRSLDDRVTYRRGAFIELAESITLADIITLDRAINVCEEIETARRTVGSARPSVAGSRPPAAPEAKVVAERIGARLRGEKPDTGFTGKGYCWIELGDGRAGFAGGDFYTEPEPRLSMRGPGRSWHWGKVAFEKWWLHRWL